MDRLDPSLKITQIQRDYEGIQNSFKYFTKENLVNIKNTALSIKEHINIINDFIQQNTSVICKVCQKVCCINRHGYYEFEDILYLCAIDEGLPLYIDNAIDDYPCQFLSKTGCSLSRHIRPFRCNWYFCIPLISYMQNQRGKDYRKFENHLHHIIEHRKMMLDLYKKYDIYYKPD